MGEIFSVNISSDKGISKSPVKQAYAVKHFGAKGDAHYGFSHRQISLLSWEDIEEQNFHLKRKGFEISQLKPGDFAENITTKGVDLSSLKIGDKIRVGPEVILEVTQIGKKCHDACEIYKKIGSCIMPKRGIFAKVLKEGWFRKSELIFLIKEKIGIITVSDSCFKGKREDESGKVIQKMVASLGKIVEYKIVPDEKGLLKSVLLDLTDEKAVDLVLTTGGTGISPRDITPDVTKELIDKKLPGFGELVRIKTFSSSPTSILSRAVAGIRGKTIVVNLPGSPRGVEECLAILLPILPHAFEMIRGLSHEHG